MKKAGRKSSKRTTNAPANAEPIPFTPNDPEWPRVVATVAAARAMKAASAQSEPARKTNPSLDGITLTAEQVQQIEGALHDVVIGATSINRLAKEAGDIKTEWATFGIELASKIIAMKGDVIAQIVGNTRCGFGCFTDEFEPVGVTGK